MWLRWTPTSDAELRDAEARMLSLVKTPFRQEMVRVGPHRINTLVTESTSPSGEPLPPLVLVHGFGGGMGLWTCNIDALAQHYTVYAVDMLGFGRSSRPRFRPSAKLAPHDQAEAFWVDALAGWSEALQLPRFTLVGHSLGGYVSGAFALRHPERVQRLVLVAPFGVPVAPPTVPDVSARRSTTFRVLKKVLWDWGTPQAALRAVGPLGPTLMDRLASRRYRRLFPFSDNTAMDYIYHLQAQPGSGEHAFKHMVLPGGYSPAPLTERLHALPPSVHVSWVYGARDFIDWRHGAETIRRMEHHREEGVGEARACSSTNKLFVLPDVGHHLYSEALDAFTRVLVHNADDDPHRVHVAVA